MNLQLIYELLIEKNIPMKLENTILKEDTGPWNDYRKLQFTDDKWELIFVKWERANGEETPLKTFPDEKMACKYFYLCKLGNYYALQRAIEFKLKNKDLNFYEKDLFNLGNLKEALYRAGIPDQYYSLDGKLKKHSVFLERVNEKESRFKFIGSNLQ